MTIVEFRYGLRRGSGPARPGGGRDSSPWLIPAEVTDQLAKVHAFRQDLVSIEHAHEAALKGLWSSVPEIAAVEGWLAAAEEEVQGLLEQARQEHSRQRALGTSGELAGRISAARARARELRQQRRDLISTAAAARQGEVAALKQQRLDAITACRRRHAAAGLYWGSYHAALSHHQVAVQAVAKRRARNLPARLKHRRHDGSGTIAVQLHRETGGVSPQERARIAELAAAGMRPGVIAAALAEDGYEARTARTIGLILKQVASGRPAPPQQPGDPPRSPQLLASGEGKWRNVLQIRPWMPPEKFAALPRAERRRIARTGEAVLAVGDGRTVTIPVTINRMLPADAEVLEASLTLTRLAGQHDAALNLTVKVPDRGPPARKVPPVALHAGWRQRGDGSVRVGVWSSPVPLEVPAHLTHVLVPADSRRHGEIIIPAGWMDRAGYAASARSIRDTLLGPVQEKLAAWLDTCPQDELPGGDVRQWRSPGRFAALALRWRDDPPRGEGSAEIAALLEDWRVRDRHIWEIESHDRDQLTRRRDDAWRKAAAWLADHTGTLVTDDSDFAALRRRGDDADDDPVLPGAAQQKARARAALAAPGRLRQLAVRAARRRGVPVREVKADFLTRTCPACGVTNDAHSRYAASARVTCPACRHSYDQDFSAAKLMLARAGREVPP
jgi:hypothetical protein